MLVSIDIFSNQTKFKMGIKKSITLGVIFQSVVEIMHLLIA